MATCNNKVDENFANFFTYNGGNFDLSELFSIEPNDVPLEGREQGVPEELTVFPRHPPVVSSQTLYEHVKCEESCSEVGNTTNSLSDPFNTCFSVNIDSKPGHGRKQFLVTDKGKYLVINKGVSFAANFTINFSSSPVNGFIRAFVTVAGAPIVSVKSCDSCTDSSPLGDRFMICTTPSAAIHYESVDRIHIIDIPLSELITTSEKPFAVFNFRCNSSHIKKSNCNMTLEFQLLDKTSGFMFGYESIMLKVCSCVARDCKKILSKTAPLVTTPTTDNVLKKRKASEKDSVVPTVSPCTTPILPPISGIPMGFPLDFTTDAQPDKDGFYHFEWKGKDKNVFNFLSVIKTFSEIDGNN